MKRLYRLLLLFLSCRVPAFAQQAASDSSSRLAGSLRSTGSDSSKTMPYYKLQRGATIDDLPVSSMKKQSGTRLFPASSSRTGSVNPSASEVMKTAYPGNPSPATGPGQPVGKVLLADFQIAPSMSEIPTLQRIFAEPSVPRPGRS